MVLLGTIQFAYHSISQSTKQYPENLTMGLQTLYEAMVKTWRGSDANECTYFVLNTYNLKPKFVAEYASNCEQNILVVLALSMH